MNRTSKYYTCMQMAILTLDPKEVLTAFEDNPKAENKVLKFCMSPIRGLSSATTTHVRNDVKLTCFIYKMR